MDKIYFERALTQLFGLTEDENAKEAVFQKWFEQNPLVFDSYGYDEVIPHPTLRARDGMLFVPDFLARRADGMWDIVEIKRPDTHILKSSRRRQTFYAELEAYYAQCREYSAFFDDAANRRWFEAEYGHHVQKDPQAILIAGRSEGLDKRKAHVLLADRGSSVVLQTYDDVQERLEFYRVRQFGRFEDLPGLSIHSLLEVDPLGGEKTFLFDIGVDLERNRVSVFVDEDGILTLKLLGSDERVQLLRAGGGGAFRPRTPIYLLFEVGVGAESAILSIAIDGRTQSYLTVERDRVDLELPLWLVVGSDVAGRARTRMKQHNIVVYGRTLKFAERHGLAKYFFDRMDAGMDIYVEFTDEQFMYVEGHPRFSQLGRADDVTSGRPLVQDDPARKPVYRNLTETGDGRNHSA